MMFTLEEVKKAVGGRLVSRTEEIVFATSLEITGVSTDTRTIKEGELFVALKGENFDGNDYLAKAMELGAAALITDDEKRVPDGANAVIVEDTVKALGLLANHYRFKLGCKVIAVTGSVGKTSTRNMITEVLKTGLKVHSTKANNNNEIGMSKTILSAPEDAEAIVVEMGMRGPGQISYLTKIARPDIAIITNIGYSHIGILESKDAIMNAKMEITEGLTDGGIIAINSDDRKLFDHCVKVLTINNFIAGIQVSSDDDLPCPLIISATDVKETDEGMSFGAKLKRMGVDSEFQVPLSVGMYGEPAIRNALFAIFCAYMMGITKSVESQQKIAHQIMKEIRSRLTFLKNVGLSYLTMNRNAGTLSGGEAQRIRLATQIGSALSGVLYVLDEPSIGLHQRDNQKLIDTLKSLRDLGNTVLVVEHDEATIRSADYVVDMGPGGGTEGGTIVAAGSLEEVKQAKESVTAAYL